MREEPDERIEVIAPDIVSVHPRKPGPYGFTLAEVQSVRTYKRDLLTEDMVCAEIKLRREAQDLFVELNEDIGGFALMMDLFAQALPGFMIDWRERVILPAFATNETLVFERKG